MLHYAGAVRLPAFGKINWTLCVLGRRPDGFHELHTLFQTVSLADELVFEKSHDLKLSCNDPRINVDGTNLIMRAAEALNRSLGTSHGAQIHLEKRIPSPGGLGGGSSNAAVALVGLGRLWGEALDLQQLLDLARDLGADVPFFLHGGTAAGTGRGDVIEPIPDIIVENLLIVTPDISVSTRDAFESLGAPVLTLQAPPRILSVSRTGAGSVDPLSSELKNDFEPHVFAAHPEIRRVKDTLLELGAANAALSGSGASVFAVFDKKEARQAAEKALDSESTWRKFAVSTVSRSEYREALGL
jgi:4-diphosphocytidyl-2-C-methyl-D-erythritol kinase